MPLTLSALIVAATMPALMQGAANVQSTAASAAVLKSPPSMSARDSTRALRFAHRAQSDFEVLRRRLLPYEDQYEVGCDAVIGRYCYRQQMGFGPPPESPQVITARSRLLIVLDSLGQLLPGDRWIVGQKLRYLIEQGRPDAADSVAISCAADTRVRSMFGWCLALAGYSAQERGDYARADAAFAEALQAMPENERCAFQDLSILLDGRAAGQFRRASCQERDTLAAAFWRLVQPLYLTGVNDMRTEFLARITRMFIERDTRTPMNGWWNSDDRETLLRFGGGQWYTQLYRPPGSTREAPVASHRRGPAFNFVPDGRALASPDRLTLDDWEYADVATRSGYAPVWAGSFEPLLDNQVAIFRRGDSAVVVAAFNITDHVTTSHTKFQAGVFAAVVDSGIIQPPIGTKLDNVGNAVVSTIRAPWRPMIVSLEVIDTSSRAAGRARFALRMPAPGSRLSLSDLLLYTVSADSAPANLDLAIPRALRALRVPNNRQVGLFWETYGARPQGEAFDYALLVQPIGQSWLHRTFIKMHVKDPDRTLSLQWSEVPTVNNDVACRGVTVDLSRLKPGRYRVSLSLTARGELPVVTEREITIVD
jgi:hypothetical protein